MGMMLIGVFVYYTYKKTLPKISSLLKYILVGIRFTGLSLILFIIFEPILILTNSNDEHAKSLVFIDNSQSIIISDSANNINSVNSLLSSIKDIPGIEIYHFNNIVNKTNIDSIEFISYNNSITNLSSINNFLKNYNKTISSVNIVSDGIVNSGSDRNPINHDFSFPINTMLLGDTTKFTDVWVDDIITNDIVYSSKETTTRVKIKNHFLADQEISISFLLNGITQEIKKLNLSSSGNQFLDFSFMPEEKEQQIISVQISDQKNDKNKINNKKSKLIKVLDKKLTIGLIASSPSAELSAVKSTLEENNDFGVTNSISVSNSKSIGEVDRIKIISDSDIIVIFGNVSNTILLEILKSNKPYCFIASNNTAFSQLTNTLFPFRINDTTNFISTNLSVEDATHAIISSDDKNSWENLPPLFIKDGEFIVTPATNVLLTSKNITGEASPILVTENSSSQRKVFFLAEEIWKWKLLSRESDLFNNFINNMIKWLNADNNLDRFVINTNKNFYNPGETVDITAQLYDENFEPINEEEVLVEINSNKSESEIIKLVSNENGLYSVSHELNLIDDYSLTGKVELGNKIITSKKRKVIVQNQNLENINLTANITLMQNISQNYNGKTFSQDELNKFISEIKSLDQQNVFTNISTSEWKIWNEEYILLLIVLLFAIEWFIRKRNGLL